MNKIIKVLAVAFLVVGVTFFASHSNNQSIAKNFELDAISAATDGTECTVQAWDCAKEWEAKGYVFDKAKEGYFKGSGATTTKPVTTTKTPETTKTTTTKVTTPTTTKKGDTTAKPADTTAPAETTLSPTETTAPGETTAPVETTVAPEETTAVVTTAPASEEKELPVALIGGGLVLVAVVGFFIFKGMSGK